jgi:hypothetical protein
MRRVLPACIAELRELQPTGRGLLVLGSRIVPVLAIRALKRNDFAHDVTPSEWSATSADKQLDSSPEQRCSPDTRHAATQAQGACNPYS